MLPKIIPILGEKWDKALEKWRNGKGRSFQQAHEEYMVKHNDMGRQNILSTLAKNKKTNKGG